MKGIVELDTPLAKEFGFTSDKFFGYLWQENNTIIISAIMSLQEGQGHLSSLLNEIWSRGYTIQVPTPLGKMEAILKAKGFEQKWIDSEEFGAIETYIKEPS